MSPLPRRHALLLAALAAVLLPGGCGGGGSAPGGTVPPARDVSYRVSDVTRFVDGCDGAVPAGTLYVNSEVEPFVAVNPRDVSNLVAVWQQDRWSGGGARGLLTGTSLDGGRSWTPAFPAFSRCTGGNAANGGDYERASDPWITFAPDGTAHQVAIAFNGRTLEPGSASAVLASRSTDGGRTWSAPAVLIRDGSLFFNDKESITADPADPRLVYAVWDRLALAGGGPALLARSTDGGLSWEAPRVIHDPGIAGQTLNNQVVVLPDGTLVDFFTRFDFVGGTARATLAIARSLDKGLTWSAPIAIAPVQAVGTRDPEAGTRVRDAANLGAIAVGPRGELVVAWQDARFSGGARDGIAFARSQDGGLTWSVPARINGDPAVAAFVPAVHVRRDGTIGVTYYDFRSNTADPAALPTDYWLAQSADGATWTETRIAGPFDLATAPFANGLFVGDYQGLASVGGAFLPVYAKTNDGSRDNRTDIWASLAASAQAATAQAAAGQAPGLPAAIVVQAAPAPPLAMTPELERRLTESAARTLEARAPGLAARVLGTPPLPGGGS
jgi:hypothetical protein